MQLCAFANPFAILIYAVAAETKHTHHQRCYVCCCDACRQKRLQELRAAAAKPRFGTLEEISSSEFVQKVTNASENYWVVCFLYKASHAGMQRQTCRNSGFLQHVVRQFKAVAALHCQVRQEALH